MSKPEITVNALSKTDAESKYGISKWGTWGCGVSNFDWYDCHSCGGALRHCRSRSPFLCARRQYSGTETAYVLSGKVIVTPTGAWSACKAVEIKAGDLCVFPDGMTCTWDVTEPIQKHYSFD
jgi:uncharacterized cupin superfamily protein